MTEKHWDKIHDTITGGRNSTKTTETRERVVRSSDEDPPPSQPPQSAVSGRSSVRRKQKNRLPSPEGSIEAWDRESHSARSRDQVRSPSLDRESQRSEQVIRAYEADRSDPPARPEAVLPQKDLRKLRRDSRMSYGNQGGYANSNLAPSQYDNRRQSQSQQPPRSRYDDDEGSDYDERTGQRYRSSGKGYDDRGYDDDYDREVVTTERYKGVSGALVVSRPISFFPIPSNSVSSLAQRPDTDYGSACPQLRPAPPKLRPRRLQPRPLQRRRSDAVQPAQHHRSRRLPQPPLSIPRPSRPRPRLALSQPLGFTFSFPLSRARWHPRETRRRLRHLDARPRGRTRRRRGRWSRWPRVRAQA